jgi:simple sugar transport system permease protein
VSQISARDPDQEVPGSSAPSVMERWNVAHRPGGIITPVLTATLAFVVGGIVVLVTTGKNPLSTYKAIFEGAGLSWFFDVGGYDIGLPFTDARVWFPWNTDDGDSIAAYNLQQTLILTTTLVLTGLAVAFAFRCGLFNIGGQGQYLAGSIVAVWVGAYFSGIGAPWHAVLAVAAGTLAGAAYAGIAGILRATVGVHEVISTIMLNWIAVWVGAFLVSPGGPMQSQADPTQGVSPDILESAKLAVFWGDPGLQGLHVGLFVALVALVVYSMILNRTTLGYEVRAVGLSPDAARYGGISVSRSIFLAMAISGAFAGLAGAVDLLGWQSRLNVSDVTGSSQIAFVGIAVALLGRNTAIGVLFSSLLFAGLITGTSTRNLESDVFPPELASNLTLMIQGMIVLFVAADLLVLLAYNALRRRRAAEVGS